MGVQPRDDEEGQDRHERAEARRVEGGPWAAMVVIAALVAIMVIFGLSILRWDKAAQVATAVGSVSGVIAALVGAYFGIRSSGIK
jgi:hypothetical protein